ncbi:hypothetical protein L7F22_005179 [Adiantum nelumboides]|nr:hypothetical protein [Adiantum nelumboides]
MVATFFAAAKEFVLTCDEYQQAKIPTRVESMPLRSMMGVRAFAKWGIDFVEPLQPLAYRTQAHYFIVATDYLIKCAEAKATRKNDAETISAFLYGNAFMRYGLPIETASDRGTHLLNEFGEADGERVQVSFYRSYGKTFKKPRRRGPRYKKEQRLNMNAELMLVGDQHAWARQDEKNARRMFRSILILPCQGGRVLKAASKKAAGSKLVGGCCGGVFVNYLQRFNEFAKGFPHIPLEPSFQKEDVNGNAPISTELEKVQHSGASMESFKSDEEDEDNDYDDTVFHEDCFSGYAVDQRDEGTADNCMSHFAAMDVAIDSKDSFQAAMTKMNRELIALYESRSRTEKKNSQEALRKKLKELLEPVTGVMKSQGERVEAAMSILKSSTGRSRRCQLEKFYGDVCVRSLTYQLRFV